MLLPSGFTDTLSPQAEMEALASQTLMGSFADYGYSRVAPPLMEFEETLLSGAGASMARSTFRVMDPISQRMLGIRTDHTLQIGRIAASRLYDVPRPLRLSYAGPALRLQAGETHPQRQVAQVGAELIGSLAPEADAEIIALALYGLQRLSIKEVSVDLLLPTLIPALCEAENMSAENRAALSHALDRKDEAAVLKMNGNAAKLAVELLRASGDAKRAMDVLAKMDLPEKAAVDRTRLTKVLALLGDKVEAPLTIDLVEYRGFEYQTGLSFAVFSKKSRKELARGGRYRTGSNEPATGFTFYTENLLGEAAPLPPRKTKTIPFNLSLAEKNRLIADGWVLVHEG